jgi:hypothetical protein
MCHPRLVDALITFPEWLHDCLILIDEIAVYFPSLRATSTAALNFSTFLQEIRKLRVDMVFTTQFPTMIIGQASLQIDLFVEPYLYQFNTNEVIPAFWHASRNDIMEREWTEEFAAEASQEESEPAHVQAVKPQSAGFANLKDLLDAQPQREIELREIIDHAKRLDPKIKRYGQLADTMRRYGWACYRDATGKWMGEKCDEPE